MGRLSIKAKNITDYIKSYSTLPPTNQLRYSIGFSGYIGIENPSDNSNAIHQYWISFAREEKELENLHRKFIETALIRYDYKY